MRFSVYCFSGAGHSLNVAEFIADELGTDVQPVSNIPLCNTETAVIVFPVYCQNIPAPVKNALKLLPAKRVAVVAVYGGISAGNTLREAESLLKGTITAAAYVPSGHTYLNEPCDFDRAALFPLIERLKSVDSTAAVISEHKKDFLADILPEVRSRIGVKIKRNSNCTDCGACSQMCPLKTMENGHPGRSCIRCLKCVNVCPSKALDVKYSLVLMHYLNSKKRAANNEVFL